MEKMITDIELLPEAMQEEIKRDIENRILPQARNVFEDTPEEFSKYIEDEIKNAVKCKNDMINASQNDMINPNQQEISKTYVYNTERIKALKRLREELLVGNAECLSMNKEAPKLNQEPRKENGSKSKRKRGRPKETLKDKMIKDKMINDADGSKLQKIHKVMDGKKGKDAALIILACIKMGWMLKPTFPEVKKEFGDIGSRQNFTKYLKGKQDINEKQFTEDEIEGVINSLMSA